MAFEHTHKQEPELNQRRLLGEKWGAARKVWKRIGEEHDNVLEPPSSPCDGPFAQAEVQQPPEPAARSTQSTAIHTSKSPNVHTSITEHSPHKDQDQHTCHTSSEEQDPQTNKHRKLKVALSEELLSTLRVNCAAKAAVTLFGRIQGKHPGLKALTAWAKATLHPSLILLYIAQGEESV
jgi:hypothetical protein